MVFQLRHILLYPNIVLLFLPTLLHGLRLRSGIYRGSPGRKIQPGYVLGTQTALSTTGCAVRCEFTDGCESVSFEPTTGGCILSYLTTSGIPLYTEADADWETYSKGGPLLVFRAPKGIDGDVYESFVNSVGITTDHVGCIDLASTTCNSNYRHPILESWATANITQVRFSLYKNHTEAAYVVFNASGSTMTSWFMKERILDSTWTTSATDSYIIFDMDGGSSFGISFASRRFSMTVNLGSCEYDKAYAFALTSGLHHCQFDVQTTYPQFFYASTESAGYPETGIGNVEKLVTASGNVQSTLVISMSKKPNKLCRDNQSSR